MLSRSVFQQFTPLLQVVKPATGLAVVVATVAGRPSSHSSAVPRVREAGGAASKSVVNTVVGAKPGGAGRRRRRLADADAPGGQGAAVGAGGVVAQVERPGAAGVLAVEPGEAVGRARA